MAVDQLAGYKKDLVRGGVPALPFPARINDHTVTAAENETVPALANLVVMETDASIWYRLGGTAAVPGASDVTDLSGSAYLIAGGARAFYVKPGDVISVVSASGTAHVAFSYYLVTI